MKPEITTNIKWYLATETLPTENDEVLVCTRFGRVTTVYVYNGHFNCYSENRSSELLPGTVILYWAYIPDKLYTEVNKYNKQKGLD